MAVKEIKDMGASVLARIKKQSKETNINYQSCLQLFAQEEFLRKLEQSGYADNLILKGGMFLYVLTNFAGRPTMDIDFLMRRISNDIAGMEQIIQNICEVETGNDFIMMEVIGTKEITPEKEYPGVGINILAHIKKVRIPFSIDIGVDDIIVPDAVKRKVSTRLPDFEEPNILTYSLESTLAEKFDAILKRMTATSRMKDFYDLYYIPSMFDFDGRRLQEAFAETLRHRGTPYEKDSLEKIRAFEDNAFLSELWDNYNPGPGLVKPDFRSALERLDYFVGPVYQAIIKEDEFFGEWIAAENKWS